MSNLIIRIFSFVRVLECRNCLNICKIFNTNIYSDIRSCQISFKNILDIHSCKFVDANIFGYLFVLKFLRMSHSVTEHICRGMQAPHRHQIGSCCKKLIFGPMASHVPTKRSQICQKGDPAVQPFSKVVCSPLRPTGCSCNRTDM